MKGTPTDFWGKLNKLLDQLPTEWHPLVHHCADVAACAEALLSLALWQRRLAKAVGVGGFDAVQLARLAVLVALHDLGKFNLGFQAKAEAHPRLVAGHVDPAMQLIWQESSLSPRLLGALPITEMATWAPDQDTFFGLWSASIGHHGKPVSGETFQSHQIWMPQGSRDPFAGMKRLGDAIREWFPIAFSAGGAPLPSSPALQHTFSGLVMLADWLGSDRSFFPYSEPDDSDRMIFARSRATEIIDQMGLQPKRARLALVTTADSFGAVLDDRPPREAQRRAAELPIDTAGSITVLESETGSGKTEAALLRFLELFRAGEVDGLYFALPTRTAATQIYQRVHKATKRAFPSDTPPVVLAVPGYLNVDGQEGKRLAPFEVLWNDQDSERTRYRCWAAENPKRFLAGPIVIGTVDQVLLSALAVNHAHLRATALLRHLLVVDEVHASDAYMTRLLEEVLQRHVTAGGHALLMSATLGSEARTRLLTPGRPKSVPSLRDAIAVPYPVITHQPNGGARAVIAIAAPEKDKRIRILAQPIIADPQTIACAALDAAIKGARVAVIRNTVRDCIATQEALEALAQERNATQHLFTCGGRQAPHHARFAHEDRTALDNALKIVFGRGPTGTGCVVVATQTIQQALDLDFDLLLTDLCPMDVLLQRLGRLHRHAERMRPAGFEEPCTILLVPPERDLSACLKKDGTAQGRHGIGFIYEDLFVLEATWRLIEEHQVLAIPSMNRMLVEHATHAETRDEIVRSGGDRWKPHHESLWGKNTSRKLVATHGVYKWDQPLHDQAGLFSDGRRKETRLGEEDRLAEFDTAVPGPFGKMIHRLTIPSFMAKGVPPEASVTDLNIEPERMTFSLGQQYFVYDRLGLRLAEGDYEDE